MDNGWSQWQRHVLSELERLSRAVTELSGELVETRIDVASLSQRVTILSGLAALAGLVSFIAGVIIRGLL